MWAEKREIDFAGKVVHACIASHYESDGLDRLCATEQSKSHNLKTPKFKTEKRLFELRVGYFSLNLI